MSTDISAEADRAEREASSTTSQTQSQTQTSQNRENVNNRNSGERSPLLGDQQQQPRHQSSYDSDELIVFYSDHSYYVRILRWLIITLTVFYAIWCILILVDMFVTIPFFSTPGSNFLELDMSIASLVLCILTLKFFTNPTYGDLVLNLTGLLATIINTIVLAAVPILRHRHLQIAGIVSWISFIITWDICALTQWMVIRMHKTALENGERRGKRVKRWFQSSVSFALRLVTTAAVVVLTGFLVMRVGSSVHDGVTSVHDLVMIDNQYGVHIKCTPLPTDSNTTIIAEAGQKDDPQDFTNWMISDKHQVCWWSRPGMGESDSAPSPQSAGSIADALTQALNTKQIGDDLVLISHGTGGIFSRVFASRHSTQLSTIMLVEALHEDQYFEQLTIWHGLRAWMQGVLAPLSHGRYSKARLQQQFSRELSKTELKAADNIIPKDTPLVVVSSSDMINSDPDWSNGQRRLTKLTDNNIAWSIIDGPHKLWKNENSMRQLQALLNDVLIYRSLVRK